MKIWLIGHLPISCCRAGELKEIKQDISRLHYELAERGSSDMERLANLIRHLDEVMQKKGAQAPQKRV